jgi:hypothetical protein
MPSSAANKPTNYEYAAQCCAYLPGATYDQALRVYDLMLNDPNLDDYVLAEVGRCDRFFLLSQILRRPDVYDPWLYERCREVEAEPDGCLDLWSREHYKSTIITFAGSIQELVNDVEISIGIFSHTRPIAKAFLNQIKQECELNPLLPRLYPDVFWENPRKEAPSWSLDGGIVLKRKSVSNMASVEAWGLVDSQPTSKHFKLMIYDDVVTLASVNTPEMIIKTTEAWELSRHLASKDGDEVKPRTWHIGTRYNYADTYHVILSRDVLTPRIYPATEDGTMHGKPVFLTQEQWDEKKKESSDYTIACQMLQNPIAGSEQEFKPEWLRKYEIRPLNLNVAILGDPASSKKKESSNTALAVIGIDQQFNKYLLDGAYHKMNLAERWTMLKYLYFKWLRAPGIQVVQVGYERYGMQADIEHFQEMMQIEKCPVSHQRGFLDPGRHPRQGRPHTAPGPGPQKLAVLLPIRGRGDQDPGQGCSQGPGVFNPERHQAQG